MISSLPDQRHEYDYIKSKITLMLATFICRDSLLRDIDLIDVIAGRRATGPSLLYYRVINRLVSRRTERRAGLMQTGQ